MLTAVHVIGPKNNSSAGTKWQGAVFEICERHPRGAISPCALERHVLYLAASATAYGGAPGGKAQEKQLWCYPKHTAQARAVHLAGRDLARALPPAAPPRRLIHRTGPRGG